MRYLILQDNANKVQQKKEDEQDLIPKQTVFNFSDNYSDFN